MYDPHIQYQGDKYLYQGLSNLGQGISGGVQDWVKAYRKNQENSGLNAGAAAALQYRPNAGFGQNAGQTDLPGVGNGLGTVGTSSYNNPYQQNSLYGYGLGQSLALIS